MFSGDRNCIARNDSFIFFKRSKSHGDRLGEYGFCCNISRVHSSHLVTFIFHDSCGWTDLVCFMQQTYPAPQCYLDAYPHTTMQKLLSIYVHYITIVQFMCNKNYSLHLLRFNFRITFLCHLLKVKSPYFAIAYFFKLKSLFV